MDDRTQIEERFQQTGLWGPTDRILVACSGGVDSVVLAHLFRKTGAGIGLAHVNFQLRGTDAEADARWVRSFAESLEVPFFLYTVDTKAEKRGGESIQMAARRIRYSWLEALREKEGYHWLATGHQADDTLETFFLNFARGSGLKGLTGIPRRRGCIIRPLLSFTRAEIEAYARAEGLDWREDASNTQDKYQRNFIRHRIVPLFREINPDFHHRGVHNLELLRESWFLYREAVDSWTKRCVRELEGRTEIDLQPLRRQPAAPTLLFEWLGPLGFTPDQCRQVLGERTASGATFHSPTHTLLLDRRRILVKKTSTTDGHTREFLWPESSDRLHLPGLTLRQEKLDQPPRDPRTGDWEVFLDTRCLKYPLKVRKWQPGDRFQPLGMEGHTQKLQDLFTHLKLDRWSKERVWLLLNADGEICWVIGFRPDHRCRISAATRSCVHLRALPEARAQKERE